MIGTRGANVRNPLILKRLILTAGAATGMIPGVQGKSGGAKRANEMGTDRNDVAGSASGPVPWALAKD